MADEMFRPPINRSMLELDKAFFGKIVPLKAARVFDNKNISRIRKELERSKDALTQSRIAVVVQDPDTQLAVKGSKCVLLKSEQSVKQHSEMLERLASEGMFEIIDYNLHLDYDYWTYHEIISAILPEDDLDEIPSGFTQTGHIAHLNLRDEYVKHKNLIAQILIDKNPSVTTVINKINDVGEENEYRTFLYEVLAGKDDMNVTISEDNCIFQFDFSKVYWNSRLNTEHRRLTSMFNEGEAVCDVMAGIGPFAVPAGKKGVFVWANDLNPESYTCMKNAISRNKVGKYVQAFNEDGHTFIKNAVRRLIRTDHKVDVMSKPSRSAKDATPQLIKTLHQPKTFQHFVMNLPASALSFLPDFVGLYAGLESKLAKQCQMPIVHAYCFNTKSEDNAAESAKICEEISTLLQHPMKLGHAGDGHVEIHDVRDVAPKKRMFCASFRLPEEVAFRQS